MEAYITSADPELQKIIGEDIYQGHTGITRSTGTIGRTFKDYDTSVSVKSEYTRQDYEHFRPSESIRGLNWKKKINLCGRAYEKIGIVKNVIDLMSDFACTGIRFQHKNKAIENFYNTWFYKIDGVDRSERFLNLLYRIGNVVVRRSIDRINITDVKQYRRAVGKNISVDDIKTKRREIPMGYTYYNPVVLETVGNSIANFANVRVYKLALPTELKNDLKSISKNVTPEVRQLILDQIPSDILAALNNSTKDIILDPLNTDSYFYKKDDWQTWANPMTFSILDDLVVFDKLRLADISALDGAISNVRLWTLGIYNEQNPLASIVPTAAGINKLKSVLSNGVGGGTLDLIWGPELRFTESSTNVHQFLGPEKYKATLDIIYDGLGIPVALRAGQATGTNNYLSLGALIERLEYGRQVLLMFWYKEAELIRKAMDFPTGPTIIFDHIMLADEAAEKALWIQLVDRDYISPESLQERFGRDPEIEQYRINRNAKKRGKSVPYKAGPYHNPLFDIDLKKIALQGGIITPSEAGLELDEKKAGEKSGIEMQISLKQLDKEKKLKTGQPGRPLNVTETKKRKPKPKGLPRTSANELSSLFIWANEAQKTISSILSAGLLEIYGRPNFRQLTRDEFDESEKIKFNVLCNLEPYVKITAEIVYNNLKEANEQYKVGRLDLLRRFTKLYSREPILDELRQINSSAFSIVQMEKDDVTD